MTDENNDDENKPFDILDMLGRIARTLVPVVVLVSGLYTLLNNLGGMFLNNSVDLMAVGKVLLWSEVLVIGLLLAIPLKIPSHIPETMAHEARYSNAVEAAKQFSMYWVWTWIALFVFYAVQAYEWSNVMHGKQDGLATMAENICYLGSTTFMLLCYFTLVVRIVDVPPAEWHRIVFFVVLTSVVMIVAGLVGDGALVDIPAPHNTLLRQVMVTIPKFFCGVVLALLVGRFEGRFMGTKRGIVIALYVYALLQIVFVEPNPANSDENHRFLIVVTLALFLKVLLFWEFLRLIRSGTLVYYMYAYRKLLDEDDERRTKFLAMLFKKDEHKPLPLPKKEADGDDLHD